MGYSYNEITDKRASAEALGFPVGLEQISSLFAGDQKAAASIREQTTQIASADNADMERIEFEGKVTEMQGPLSEREIAATKAVMAGEKFDEDRRAENSGTRSGRISITGAADREKQAAKAQAKARANADARMQKLLALQAQLDDLDREIAGYDKRLETVDTLLSRIEDGEIFEVGRDGELLDQDAERELKDYEYRTGRKVNRHDMDAIEAALEQEREFIEQQKDRAIAKKEDIEAGLVEERAAFDQAEQKDIISGQNALGAVTLPSSSAFSFAKTTDEENEQSATSLAVQFETAALSPKEAGEPSLKPDLVSEKEIASEQPIVFGGLS